MAAACTASSLIRTVPLPVVALCVACGGTADKGDPRAEGDARVQLHGGIADSGPNADDSGMPSNWERVQNAFGQLETVAGAGRSDRGNEWQAAFEGAGAREAELSRPHMAMADADGNIYIADKEAHGIRKVSPAGAITTVAGTSEAGDAPDTATPAVEAPLSNPNGLWVQPDGTVFILDLGNRKVRRVSIDGDMTTLFAAATLSVGRGLWVADDESEVLVASGRSLLRWTPADGVGELATGFASLGMVLRGPDGRVWVGDRGAHQVFAIDRDGAREVLAGQATPSPFEDGVEATRAGLHEPRAVWPFEGGFFVGLHAGHRVVYVDDQGVAHLFLDGGAGAFGGDGEDFDAPGQKINEVRSLTVSAAGDLLIVEGDEGRVRVVRAR